jgi:type I restriction enzyme, S subunit
VSLPKYTKYKNSGVEWLGDVPQHWELRRVRRLFEIKKRIAGELGYDVLSITQQGIKVKDLERNDGQLSMDYSKYQFVEIGDFAMNHMDLLTGYVDISPVRGVTSPDYRVFAAREPDASFQRYFLYLFQFGYHNKIFYAFGQGSSQLGRWRLPTDQFNDLVFPVPPKHEQQAVAYFLDRETAKIDALTAEQQRLVDLLKEKRQGVISHAVTKGLDPHVAVKDSGIEWLGEVPAHWEISQLRFEVRPGTSITYGIVQAGPHVEDGIPYIRTSDMSGNSLPLSGYARTSVEIDGSYKRSKVSEGDIVIAIRATVGKCLPVPRELAGANLTQGTAKVAPGSRVLGAFLLRYLNSTSAQSYFDQMAKGATFREITLDALRRTPIPVPPKLEQESIALFVAASVDRLDKMIREAEESILLLIERRNALISAAVTGQIDVRQLPGTQAAA